ncbi:MAG TPA: RnfH family protein [Nevskiaceae bacterium]|nr:RnfH family protein [Nevskiaceae bacterium]
MSGESLTIELVRDQPEGLQRLTLQLPPGSRVADALSAAGWPAEATPLGIFGRLAGPDQGLHDGDRLEWYRPLQRDPKEARRARAPRRRR